MQAETSPLHKNVKKLIKLHGTFKHNVTANSVLGGLAAMMLAWIARDRCLIIR